eukprot:5438216-Pleurochrysis_carterae.AAC.2
MAQSVPDAVVYGRRSQAIAAQRCGHAVVMFTSYHDEGRCFEETRNGTLRVVVVGGWLPRAIGG